MNWLERALITIGLVFFFSGCYSVLITDLIQEDYHYRPGIVPEPDSIQQQSTAYYNEYNVIRMPGWYCTYPREYYYDWPFLGWEPVFWPGSYYYGYHPYKHYGYHNFRYYGHHERLGNIDRRQFREQSARPQINRPAAVYRRPMVSPRGFGPVQRGQSVIQNYNQHKSAPPIQRRVFSSPSHQSQPRSSTVPVRSSSGGQTHSGRR